MAYSGIRFGQGINVYPCLPPKDYAANSTDTLFVDLQDANWVTFLFNLGALTSDPSDTVTFTVYATATSTTDTGTTAPFWYRISSASATNTWGAITAGSSDGVALTGATDDNKSVLIDIDPVQIQKALATARYCYVAVTLVGPITLMSATAFVEHKFPGNTMSST